jgi:hypothetical protein
MKVTFPDRPPHRKGHPSRDALTIAMGAVCALHPVAHGASPRPGLLGKGTEPSSRVMSQPAGEIDPPLGTPDPILLRAIAPDGHWAFVCQDRDPDSHRKDRTVGVHGETDLKLRPYLIVSGGPGFPIDDLIATDPTGRFVVAQHDGRLTLIDTKTVQMTVLEQDPDGRPAEQRLVAFDGRGRRLLYVRTSRGRHRLVVRELADGRESTVEAGRKSIERIQLTSNGQWIIADLADRDESAGVVTDWNFSPCAAHQASYFAAGPRSPKGRSRAWARVGDALLHEVPGLIRPVNRGVLVRDSDESIVLVSGTRKEVRVPHTCGGRSIYSDDAGQRLLVVCAGPGAQTGILTELDGDRSFSLGMAPVPANDLAVAANGTVVHWGDFTIDTVRHAEVPVLQVSANAVKMVAHGVLLRRRGVYAVRGDGAELTASEISDAPESSIPMGPLRWLKPDKSGSKASGHP